MGSLVRAACLCAVLALGMAPPASALETRLTELRVAGGSIRASLEIRDLFPAKFRAVLEEGAAIHLRLQIELWEDRPVWDKLAQPAVVTVFRIALDPGTRQVTVTDRYGELSRQPAWQEPLTLRPDIGRADALSDGARYYVRVLATLGTILEKETEQASKAVFGEDDGSVSLAAMGKMLFHAVLQASDYLQSVSSETRTRDLIGRDVRAGVRIQ
jgi:hypothetical protein